MALSRPWSAISTKAMAVRPLRLTFGNHLAYPRILWGNFYIADKYSHRIRKVDENGIITTVAGIGKAGYIGDGGPATQAQLYHPTGVTVDLLGNLYVADKDNHVIRKIDAEGIISTVAGTGEGGYGGDGGLATQARLPAQRLLP